MKTFKKYELVWEDDFNGSLDTSVWGHEIGYVRNNEIQWYTDSPENSYTENSCLVLVAKPTGDPNMPYTSASVHTKKTMSFLYGRIEMKAKLPAGQGIWPAFWTLGQNIDEISWPACGEIDILELIGGPFMQWQKDEGWLESGDNIIQSTIHYPNELKGHENILELMDQNFCDDFHVFGIEWTKEEIKFYVDGYVYNRVNIVNIPAFHKEHYILMNIAMGGIWAGNPDETTIFPQKYYIDWIRYYK